MIGALNVDSIVLAGDFNAKSPWWGCLVEDDRGAKVVESLARLDLHVLNVGNVPTFYTIRNKRPYTSIVDISLCSSSVLNRVSEWRVDPNLVTLSDHRAVRLSISMGERTSGTGVRRTTRKYNTSKADWPAFATTLSEILKNKDSTEERISNINEPEALEVVIQEYVGSVTEACDKTIRKMSSTVQLGKSEWWTEELSEVKRDMIRKRSKIGKSNPRRKPFVVAEYLSALETYKQLITDTITSSWKAFCGRQERETVWDGIYRIIRKRSSNEGERLLRSPSDQSMLSPRKSAELLACTFYPQDEPSEDSIEQRELREMVHRKLEALEPADPVSFTLNEIEEVLAGMSPKKSPGEDGLTADICFRAYRSHPKVLLGLYNKCLELACFPKTWKKATIKIIPKPHKEDYAAPKSYRPIGLLPILGKVLEKMFANRILWQLGGSLNPKQYGFMPMKSTEEALYDAVEIIEAAVRGRKIAVAVSLDIEGAFDNAWWPAIVKQLLQKHLDPALIRLVTNYLSSRSVTIRYSGEQVSRETNKGCIQGSTCGPLLWNILLDSLLVQTANLNVHVQAFADDILLIATGKYGEIIERDVNAALKLISEWGTSNKLRFAPHKTQVTIFTKKLKYYKPVITMAGAVITPGDSVKLLGLTLDSNLNYLDHISEVTNKAVNLYKGASRTARAHWGLNSDILKIIYISVVEPTILYAANVWALKGQTTQIKVKLDRVARMFGIMICKGHRTIFLSSSILLSGILPLDLRALERRDFYLIKKGKLMLDTLPGRELERQESPFDLPHPAMRVRIDFDSVETIEEDSAISKDTAVIYTDGSKIEGKVGAAASFWLAGEEVRNRLMPLANYCSVFQAELVAIRGALQIMMTDTRLRKAKICSDSRSSLQCLNNPSMTHPLVANIRRMINNLTESGGDVQFYWVKAHVGILGNERADELAKKAALECKTAPVYDRFPASLARHHIRDATLAKWQKRYSESSTGGVTRGFFPEARTAHKTLKTITLDNLHSQLFTGHGGFKSYLFRFKLAPDPFCSCDGVTHETVVHLINDCPRFSNERYECECRMGRAMDNILVNDENCRTEFLKFASSIVRKAAKANGSKVK